MSTFIVHEDMYSMPGYPAKAEYFIDIRIECVPSLSRLPWRRWFCEVLARRSIWPPSKNPEATEHIWTHYYTHDFHASSLRRAFWRSDEVAWKLYEEMMADPDLRPDAQAPEHHAHPGQ